MFSNIRSRLQRLRSAAAGITQPGGIARANAPRDPLDPEVGGTPERPEEVEISLETPDDAEPTVDVAAVVERGDALPDDLEVVSRPLDRHSAFYIGFVGALGVLAAWGLVLVLAQLSQVLIFLLVAIFLALGLNPVVESLIRRGLSRGWSVLIVFVGLTILFALIGALVLPPVVQQSQKLITEAPDLLSRLQHDRVFKHWDAKYHFTEHAQHELKTRLTSGAVVSQLFGGVLGVGKAILDSAIGAFTVLVLTLYFLVTLPRVKAAAYRLVPLSRRTSVVRIGEEISRRVGGYVMGQVVVAIINGLLCFVMLEILRLPYAVIIAVTVAFLALIPIVGTVVGGALVVIVALLASWPKAVIMLVYYILYHVFESYLLAPRIMRHAVELPPAVTVIAIVAGGTLLGVIGALIAIPVAAGILVIYEEVVVPRQQRS